MDNHVVELMVRPSCGSCARVAAQIEPIVQEAGWALEIVNVDEDSELAMEFGDRVPVTVVDGEEFSCWEVDSDQLRARLSAPM
ncbi:glutaredoxin family protein [Corynebacterium tapiri]|uniref:Glutaredoxin family protein n=1 Tax=Corynebacterium tapiri TaxID=1448266 RepID=A0A5C4U4M1_9CORY|nr:glutaredoxin family protein [Corynebacterium tapiri]TNL97303.1 glutaredoxin family protein [Corynebacterium tapiri]